MSRQNKDFEIPIEEARNLGPQSGKEFRTIGIDSLGKLKEMGWEQACIALAMEYPSRVNLNAFTSIIGAIYNQDWRFIDPELKDKAKELLKAMKS